jgi:hypothetical protein
LEADNRPIPVKRVPHFKVEPTRSIAATMLPGDWAASRDLQDVYLHVPVHPQSIVKALVAPLHTLGLKLHFYLDDWLLRNASKDILKTQIKLLIKNVKLAGWIMNEEKSDLTPSQDFISIWDLLLHPCVTNVPSSGKDHQDNVQSHTAVRSKVLSGKGILKSHWPSKLSGR